MDQLILMLGGGVFIGLAFGLCDPEGAGNFYKNFVRSTRVPEEYPTRGNTVRLFLISFLALYFELLIIRWLSTEIRYFAYFKNFPLIAAFLGLGLGCALARRKTNLFIFFPWLSGGFILSVLYFGHNLEHLFVVPSFAEYSIWGMPPILDFLQVVIFYVFFLGFFFVNLIIFICLGQPLGRLLLPFPPLTAYSINIFGSLAGIILFSVISYLSWPPVIWFSIGFAVSLFLLKADKRVFAVSALVYLVVLVLVQSIHAKEQAIWSPYYKITVKPYDLSLDEPGQKNPLWGYEIRVNRDKHQWALNLSSEFTAKYPAAFPAPRYGFYRDMPVYYDLPYRIVKPQHVLIIGGGSGNDAAAALRNGVTDIDVVEIDPKIIELGRKLHPENPYASSSLRVINDDARSYLKKSRRKYDLIVFGFLDSLTMFANMSSIRLDNFVYTLESFQDAKKLLTPEGAVFLSFALRDQNIWIGPRIDQMLAQVYPNAPISLFKGRAFLAGPGIHKDAFDKDPMLKEILLRERAVFPADIPQLVTDDWPFLYLKKKTIPIAYVIAWAIIFLIFFGLIRPRILSGVKIDRHFFFLGSAFLLIETKSLVELALLFGSTWIVNSFVFSGILIMILLGNWLVSKRGDIPARVPYLCLAAALLLNYFIDFSALLNQNFLLKLIISSIIISLPVFFASIVFAVSFRKSSQINVALGSNLLGALVGGFAEYSSLIWGIKALSLVALFMYVVSYCVIMKSEK